LAGFGANGFIQKPFSPHDLIERLNQMLAAER
jgi:hypothetical protein